MFVRPASILSVIFICICLSSSFAQECEFSYNETEEGSLEKESAQFARKIVSGKKIRIPVNRALELADFLRLKNDSLCLACYTWIIEQSKKDYSNVKGPEKKASLLYIIGLSYYYTRNYKSAEAYLAKSIKAKYPGRCKFYFLWKSALGQNKNEEAASWKQTYDSEK